MRNWRKNLLIGLTVGSICLVDLVAVLAGNPLQMDEPIAGELMREFSGSLKEKKMEIASGFHKDASAENLDASTEQESLQNVQEGLVEEDTENIAVEETVSDSGDELLGNDIYEEETQEIEPVEEITYEFTKVEPDYFSDAVFLGDSRMVGIKLYSGIDNGTFYCAEGLTVYDIFTKKIGDDKKGYKTVESALKNQHFAKVYVEIGINEMGTGNVDSFMEAYEEMVDHIKELQPDATIFLCSIMHVKKEKSDKDKIFNNPNIEERNERIKLLADNKQIFYVDINEKVVDEAGNLIPEYTHDAVHLLGKHYGLLTDCLLEHGIVK